MNRPIQHPRGTRKRVQAAAFLLIWPGINTLLITAVLIDLNALFASVWLPTVTKLWLANVSAFAVIRLVESRYPNFTVNVSFWRQLILNVVIILSIMALFSPSLELPESIRVQQVKAVPVLIMFLEITIYLGVLYILNQQERSYETALTLQEAELNVLRAQSNPHFLFNTLNLITSEISNDPENAKEIVYDLADLLRGSVKLAQQPITSIEEELKLVDLYLKLQQKRFKDRLTYEIETPDTSKNYQIPALLLQPIVENTIKHAVAPYASKAHIKISIVAGQSRLEILFQDSGPPFDDKNIVEGNGFRILRKTLALNYPSSHEMSLQSTPQGGLFSLSIPRIGSTTRQ